MIRTSLFLTMAFAALSLVAAVDVTAPKASRQGMRYRTGGTIIRPVPEGSKAIVFVNATGKDSAVLDAYLKRFDAMTSSLYSKRVIGSVDSIPTENGDVVIALVAKGDLSILPAKRMAIIPVEGKDEDTLRNLWKATVAVFSLMGEPPNDFSGSALIRTAAESIGIPHAQKVFYKKALEEGWAPPPSNEFQRAVWENFKADKERGPTNPIRITPAEKK